MNEMEGNDLLLFEHITRQLNGVPLPAVGNLAVNILVNAIRQSEGTHKGAENMIDTLVSRAKTALFAQYDSVTGKRRAVLPAAQVVQMPFHDERRKGNGQG